MASYYYLMSSLPMLSSGGDMPMSYEDFLTCCRGNVDEETYSRLESLTLSSSEGPLLEEWSAAYGSLMRELNSQRSLALGKPYPQGVEKDGLNSHLVTQDRTGSRRRTFCQESARGGTAPARQRI